MKKRTYDIMRISRIDAITIHEFNELLLNWYKTSNEQSTKISSERVGVTPWIHISLGENIFRLNSDTTRSAVHYYLTKHIHSEWVLVENRNGRKNKVAFGNETNNESIVGFYLYL